MQPITLFQEHEEHGRDEAGKGGEMVPLQWLTLEKDDSEKGEDGDWDDLLNNLELHQRERTAIAHKTDTVCRHLTGILEESQKPANEDNDVERCIVRDEPHLL